MAICLILGFHFSAVVPTETERLHYAALERYHVCFDVGTPLLMCENQNGNTHTQIANTLILCDSIHAVIFLSVFLWWNLQMTIQFRIHAVVGLELSVFTFWKSICLEKILKIKVVRRNFFVIL